MYTKQYMDATCNAIGKLTTQSPAQLELKWFGILARVDDTTNNNVLSVDTGQVSTFGFNIFLFSSQNCQHKIIITAGQFYGHHHQQQQPKKTKNQNGGQ